MYRSPVTAVSQGAALGSSLFNEMGWPLVRAGVVLNQEHLDEITAHGYTRLVLQEANETASAEMIQPEVRAETLRALAEAISFLLDCWRLEREARPGLGRNAQKALSDAVARLVAQIAADAPIGLPGPSRTGPSQWLDDAINAAAVAASLAKERGLDATAVRQLAWGMLLRDAAQLYGSLAGLVQRPRELSREELDEVQKHPIRTYQLLRALDWGEEPARLVVLQHHERRDGSGYPFSLSGTLRSGSAQQRLSHVADVAAVVDVFSALIVDRPHRPALPVMEVRRILTELAGTTLHPEIVNAVLRRWRPPAERESPIFHS